MRRREERRPRSVYEGRPAAVADSEVWRQIGELDPVTGRGTVDLSRASGWIPLDRFLWDRR